MAAGEAPLRDRPTSVTAMPESDHSYIGRRGDAFEYTRIPTDGIDVESRVLVWYLGTRKGQGPAVRYQDGGSTGTLTCYDDCQFVMGATTVNGKVTHIGRIRVTNDPLIYAIMRDARAGHLSDLRRR